MKTTLLVELAITAAVERKPVAWLAPVRQLMVQEWRVLSDLLAPVIIESNKTEGQIRLLTGGCIDFWSLEQPEKCGRGRKYARVCVDEAGIAPYLQEAWEHSIRPTLTDLKGDAWFAFTPRGRSYAHRLWSYGETRADQGWASFRAPTVANPAIDSAEVEAARRDLPPAVFAQEYEGVPADDGGNPFGLKAIRDCIVFNAGTQPVCYGVDLAKHQDWTVVCGLDAGGNVATLERWQSDWEQTCRRIGDTIRDVPALVDSTGVGDPIVERLQRVCPNVEGYTFTSRSKQQLMEGLAAAIQRQEIRFQAGWLTCELESFIFEYGKKGVTYRSVPGMTDDGVCALALAAHKRHSLSISSGFACALIGGGEEVDEGMEGEPWD